MEPKKENRKRLEPSIDTVSEVRKPSKTKSFFSSFIAVDAETLCNYAVNEFLAPRMKQLTAELLKTTVDMIFKGPNGITRVDRPYNNYSRSGSVTHYRHDMEQSYRRQPTSTLPYNEPIIESYDLAAKVRDAMLSHVEEYPFLRISDFLDYANVPQKDIEWTYDDYGWYPDAVRSSFFEELPDGRYIIKIPARPRYLK